MTTGLGLVPADTPDPAGPAGEPASPFEALARRRAELHAAQDKLFVVPGYEDLPYGDQIADLVARYHRLDVEAFREALYGPAEGTLERNAQFLITALEGLYWRVGTEDGGTRLVPLNDGVESGWHDLVPHLGTEVPDDAIEQLVEGVFAGNEVALVDHAGDVGRWMQAGQRDADEAFVKGQ